MGVQHGLSTLSLSGRPFVPKRRPTPWNVPFFLLCRELESAPPLRVSWKETEGVPLGTSKATRSELALAGTHHVTRVWQRLRGRRPSG